MKRGETKTYYLRYSPIKFGVRRSSDGLWELNGKIMPFFWAKWNTVAEHLGFSVKVGEYMIFVYWFGFVDWKTA